MNEIEVGVYCCIILFVAACIIVWCIAPNDEEEK